MIWDGNIIFSVSLLSQNKDKPDYNFQPWVICRKDGPGRLIVLNIPFEATLYRKVDWQFEDMSVRFFLSCVINS